jgi:hypothetical protein
MTRLLAAFASLSLLLPAAFAAETADEKAVRAAVFDYFEGIGERNRERLNRAFHEETAQMVGVVADGPGEKVQVWQIEDVIPGWAEGQPIAKEREGEIISMNIADGRLAAVMFDYDGQYVDALTLAKIGGEWRIVQKVFIEQD